MTTPELGISRSTIEALSAQKNEPAWMTALRVEAWEAYERTPLPDNFLGFPLSRIEPFVFGAHVPVPSKQWPPELQHALDERGDEEGLIVQRDSTIQSRSISKEFSKKGVVFTDLDYALQTEPEQVQTYFGKLIKHGNPLAALSTAFWSGGSFLYVPSHISIQLPFHTCTWLSHPGRGVFSRTLLIVEEGASVAFIEEGVSSDWAEPALAVSAVEAFVGIRACVSYFQLRNWGHSVYNHREEQSEVDHQGRFLSGRMEKRAATTLEKVAELHPEVR